MKIMLGIRIHPELKKLLQDLAEKDGRSLSNYVNKVLASPGKRGNVRWPPSQGQLLPKLR